jgi:hypothetical protein
LNLKNTIDLDSVWGEVDELEGKILRVITLEDKQTIHNAFPDRGFKQ